MPAQVLRIETAKDEHEEVRYFLPTGKALSASVIVDFPQAIGVNPEVVD